MCPHPWSKPCSSLFHPLQKPSNLCCVLMKTISFINSKELKTSKNTTQKSHTKTNMNPIAEDHFDRLPDELVLFIFNKLHDAKSLTTCLAVSKRFASFVPQTNTICFSIPRRKPNPIPTCGLPLNFLKILVGKFIAKPVQYLHRAIAPMSATKSTSRNYSFHLPNEVLKNFREIQSMHLELPSQGGAIGSEASGSLLKWKAEFGKDINSCIVLGATAFQRRELNVSDEQEHIEPFLTEEELKLRILWIISSIIAASSRHYLLKQILIDHPTLHSAVISDANQQGKLYMGKEQLVELTNSMKSLVTSESFLERTRMPDLSMKMCYLPVLQLPASGYVMRGVTLVIIRPVDGKGSDDDLLLAGDFDGEGEEKKALGEALREMMKMKMSYVMTMNSF